MEDPSASAPAAPRPVTDPVSRELLRQVVRQRQRLKAEFKKLKADLAALPQDWAQRLPLWLRLEESTQAEPAPGRARPSSGEQIDPQATAAERAGWLKRERDSQRLLGDLVLGQRLKAAATAAGAYDPQDVVDLTKDLFQVQVDQDQVKIGLKPNINLAGLDRLAAPGGEPPLEEVVAHFLSQKPHLVRARPRPGSGSRPSLGLPAGAGTVDPAERARAILAERQRLRGK